MTSPAQLHLLAAASRLAIEQADRRREQTREIVATSRLCLDQSRQAMSEWRPALSDPTGQALAAATSSTTPAWRSTSASPAVQGGAAPAGSARPPGPGAGVSDRPRGTAAR